MQWSHHSPESWIDLMNIPEIQEPRILDLEEPARPRPPNIDERQPKPRIGWEPIQPGAPLEIAGSEPYQVVGPEHLEHPDSERFRVEWPEPHEMPPLTPVWTDPLDGRYTIWNSARGEPSTPDDSTRVVRQPINVSGIEMETLEMAARAHAV